MAQNNFNEDDLQAMALQMGVTGGFREYPPAEFERDLYKQRRTDEAAKRYR